MLGNGLGPGGGSTITRLLGPYGAETVVRFYRKFKKDYFIVIKKLIKIKK